MELHLSLRLSITMTNPMPAASTLQKRGVGISIRDQERHMGSGWVPQRGRSTASMALQGQV